MTAVGVRLRGGPKPFDGWTNLYDAEQLGGWPLPDEIGALDVVGKIAIVTDLATVPPEFEDDVVRYRKVEESGLPDNTPDWLVRGAVFEAIEAA